MTAPFSREHSSTWAAKILESNPGAHANRSWIRGAGAFPSCGPSRPESTRRSRHCHEKLVCRREHWAPLPAQTRRCQLGVRADRHASTGRMEALRELCERMPAGLARKFAPAREFHRLPGNSRKGVVT